MQALARQNIEVTQPTVSRDLRYLQVAKATNSDGKQYYVLPNENDYRRLDGSHHDDDVRVVFFIYLRAFGPSSMLDLARF